MTDAQKSQIQADAERAAREGYTPNERCPHPFASDQGQLWVSCYWAIRKPGAQASQKPLIDRRAH